MKNKQILFSIAFIFGFLPSIASAQSFWLHKDVGGNGGYFAVIDSTDCIMAHSADFGVLTKDCWDSWNLIIVDTPSGSIANSGPTFGGFVHPSHNLLIAGYTAYIGQVGKVGHSTGPVGHIVRSTNEGKTWADFAIGIPIAFGGPVNSVQGMAALDSNHIVVMIDSNSSDWNCDQLLISSDGGSHWHYTPTPNFSYGSTDGGNPRSPVITYLAPSTLVVASIVAGGHTIIYRSTDLGVTWDSGFAEQTQISKFAFINSRIGYASGSTTNIVDTATIDKTTDGGATWFPVLHKQIIPISSIFNSTAGLYSIAFADSLHGFACGQQGLILQTTDGGSTWNEMRSDYTIDAQSNDLLLDVAYPDTNHAMISSSDGSVLVYHPNGILSLPNIIYPIYSPPAAPQTFNVTWNPVPSATRYAITITTGGYPDSNTTLVLKDTNVTDTFYHLSDLVDTSPGQRGRQYYIYLQAFNATNQSNVATRIFIVYQGTNGVTIHSAPVPSMEVFPNPATNSISITNANGPLSILDPLGRSYEVKQTGNTLDVSTLPSGVYFVSDGYSRTKFVKE